MSVGEALVLGLFLGFLAALWLDSGHYALWTLRDGIVKRVCTFRDHGEALRTAGLSE